MASLSPISLGHLVIVLDRDQGGRVPVESDVSDPRGRHEVQHSVEQPVACPEDGYEAQLLAGEHRGLHRFQRRLDLTIGQCKIPRYLVAQQHGGSRSPAGGTYRWVVSLRRIRVSLCWISRVVDNMCFHRLFAGESIEGLSTISSDGTSVQSPGSNTGLRGAQPLQSSRDSGTVRFLFRPITCERIVAQVLHQHLRQEAMRNCRWVGIVAADEQVGPPLDPRVRPHSSSKQSIPAHMPGPAR